MADKNTSPLAESPLPNIPSGDIPVLSSVVPDSAVSADLQDALNARVQDKLDWMGLEADILRTLRPEIARLTTELVRKSLREVWKKRSHLKT
jgi:hypothetical protein